MIKNAGSCWVWRRQRRVRMEDSLWIRRIKRRNEVSYDEERVKRQLVQMTYVLVEAWRCPGETAVEWRVRGSLRNGTEVYWYQFSEQGWCSNYGADEPYDEDMGKSCWSWVKKEHVWFEGVDGEVQKVFSFSVSLWIQKKQMKGFLERNCRVQCGFPFLRLRRFQFEILRLIEFYKWSKELLEMSSACCEDLLTNRVRQKHKEAFKECLL